MPSDAERIDEALPPLIDLIEDDGVVLDDRGTEYRGDPHPAIHDSYSSNGENFSVNPGKGVWRCLRHRHGGGKLAWIAMSEGICSCDELNDGRIPGSLFRDVLEVAAGRAGVELDDDDPEDRRDRERRESDDAARRAVAEWYHDQLDAYEYRDELRARYGLSDELIDENLIGYAPPEGMGHDLPSETGVARDRLVEIGLLSSGGAPEFTDRFIFPYWVRERGERRVRYFTGRAVEWDGDGAKYHKIPKYRDDVRDDAQQEPPFGLDTVRGERTVVITEGVTDALALHDHGYGAISPVTTHFSDDAIDRVTRAIRGKDVYVVYDEDADTKAGIKGAARDAWALFENYVTDTRVARLPAKPGEDLDVADYFKRLADDGLDRADRAERFEHDVLDSVTFPAEVAQWAWGDGDAHHVFSAAIRELGFDPDMARQVEDDDGNEDWLSVADLIGETESVAEARRRFYGSGKTRWSAGDHKEAYHHVIRWVFEARGEFFQSDTGEVHYYYEPENRTYQVATVNNPGSCHDDFEYLVAEVLGITTAEWGRSLLNSIARSITFETPERPTARLAYYDDDAGELYFNRFDGHYYALDGEQVERRRNGTDVFFMSPDFAEPWSYLPEGQRAELPRTVPGERPPFVGQGDRVHRVITNRVNYDEHANLGPALQRTQLYVHLHAIAFVKDFDSRPIMAWVGEKGSGKTMVLRSIGQLLFGEGWKESRMPDDPDDFSTKVTNRTLAAIDNYDDGESWANDALASIATGSRIEKRELYTTNDLMTAQPECFLALTSRDPPFRRDDVADRCLVFRLARVGDGEFIGESTFQQQPLTYRDSVLSDYVDNLNAILRARRSDGYRATSHRMADWALFAKDCADALGVDGVDDLLDGVATERAFFSLENEPLRFVIERFMADHPEGGVFEAGELVDPFKRAAKEEGVIFEYSTSRGLSNALGSISDEIGELYGIEVREQRSGPKQYVFPSTGDAEGEHQSRF